VRGESESSDVAAVLERFCSAFELYCADMVKVRDIGCVMSYGVGVFSPASLMLNVFSSLFYLFFFLAPLVEY